MGAVGVGLLWDSRLLKLDMNERTITRLLSAIASHIILFWDHELTSISGRHLGIRSLKGNEGVVCSISEGTESPRDPVWSRNRYAQWVSVALMM
jgi:hypothetical protein